MLTVSVERRGFKSILALCSSSKMSTFSLPSDCIGAKYGAGPWPGEVDGSSPLLEKLKGHGRKIKLRVQKKLLKHQVVTIEISIRNGAGYLQVSPAPHVGLSANCLSGCLRGSCCSRTTG